LIGRRARRVKAAGAGIVARASRFAKRLLATARQRARDLARHPLRQVRRGRDLLRTVRPTELPRWFLRRVTRPAPPAPTPVAVADPPRSVSPGRVAELDALIAEASPVPFPMLAYDPTPRSRIVGCGIYLRTDFWAKIESGGSYGHTCYVAKELAAVTERFVAFMAHRYRLLDDYGLRQVVLDPPSETAAEDDIVTATA